MPFISNSVTSIKVGDKVYLTKDVSAMIGKFEAGDVLTVCEIDSVRGYGFTDGTNKIIECGFNCCERILP